MTSAPRTTVSPGFQPLSVVAIPSSSGMRLVDRGVMAAYVHYAAQERSNGRMPATFDNWIADTAVPLVVERNSRARN